MRFAIAAVALAGCAQGMAKAPKSDTAGSAADSLAGQTFGVPGEAMEYEVALSGVTVGRVQVAVGQPGFVDGRRAIIVRSRGQSAGFAALIKDLHWDLTTTLDMTTGLPIHEIEESWLEEDGEPKHQRNDHDWSGSGYNLHAAAGALRGWHSHEGQRASLDVTIDEFEISVELWDATREFAVNEPAVRYDGIARDKYKFSIWISDDESRVPLAVRSESKLGPITIELVHYDPPKEAP
ncbi:MAG TPA: DUF3108 domain-containing protein [Kofleriaceae bacterium]